MIYSYTEFSKRLDELLCKIPMNFRKSFKKQLQKDLEEELGYTREVEKEIYKLEDKILEQYLKGD